MRTLFCILFLISLTQNGTALDFGFYSDDETGRRLLDIEAGADRAIGCGKDLRLDIGIGRLVDTGLEGDFSNARSRILFEFAEVESFLKNERHKDLLVFRFDKSIMWNEREVIEEYVAKVMDFADILGYNRVVILGSHAFGMHYLADVTRAEASTPPTETP